MPTHVALLRAVNVGGVKVVMAELRALAESLGYRDVATYIQSGNLLFTPAAGSGDANALAAALSAAIEESLHVRSAVIVLSRDELAEVARANPYPEAPEPRFVHVVFLPAEPDDSAAAAVAAIVSRYGGKDEATLRGRALYLHTPGGYGTSDLAKAFLTKRSSPVAAGTARNWSTVTKLLELCGAD